MITIIVPVLNRPQNAPPFMRSLVTSGIGPCVVYVIAAEDDVETKDAWREHGAVALTSDRGDTFPCKVQQGYEISSAEWLLLVGDDVVFEHGWYQAFREAAADPSVALIATNDGHNPFVLAGNHATHPIIRRSWVDESGASWDGPGHIAHTGYHHQFVDNEWSAKARQDGVFRFAPDCRITHQHPSWVGSPTDDTYQLGARHAVEDARLFVDRARDNQWRP